MPLGAQQSYKIDSLKHFAYSSPENKHLVNVLIDISISHAEKVEEDSAVYYGNQALELASRLDLDTLIGKSYYSIGLAYDYGGDLQAALDNYEFSRRVFNKLEFHEEVISCMNSKGVAAYYQGDYQVALDFYLATLAYIDSTQEQSQLGNVLNNIGVIYRITNQNEEAINIYHRALTLYSIENDSTLMLTANQNIGVAYTFQDNLDSAVYYLDTTYDIMLAIDDKRELSSLLNAFAEAYFKCGPHYEKARQYVNQAEQIGLQYKNQEYLSKIYLLKSQIEVGDEQYQVGLDALNKGLAIVEPTDRQDLKLDYYEQAYLINENIGKTDASLTYMKQYMDLYKEVQATEKVNAIADAQTKYESIEKEKEIEKLEFEEELSSLRLSRQRTILGIAGASIVLLGLLLYNVLKQKTQIQEKNTIISKSLAEKELLLKEIHHRVKNNLQFISSLLRLQSNYVEDSTALGVLKQGQDRVRSMALIHQNLYQEDNLTGVDVKAYFNKLIPGLFQSNNIHDDRIKLQLNISDIRIDVDTIVPIGLITNELITNSLKYAFPDERRGIITAKFEEVEEHLELIITDDGIGITQEQHQSIGKSFGYKMIHAFVNQLNGEININNDQGTSVKVIIRKYDVV